MVEITELERGQLAASLDGLADVLHASVHAGASVSFILPHSMDDSRVFWTGQVFPAVRAGRRFVWVAVTNGRIVGTVQLDTNLPPNQAHRGEVAKLLVHPDFRRRCIARQLMETLEERARSIGKNLVTLDTRTGDAAEPLYRSLGYHVAGVIPGYCRAPDADRYDSTTYMYKAL
jgi:ribosomal protein S18 acetylase RimI-like enzyme